MDSSQTGADGTNAGMQQSQQGQNPGGAPPANFMSLLSQMQGAAAAPQGQQVPLLVGATPLQQQISALQGLAGGGGQLGNNQNNNLMGGGAVPGGGAPGDQQQQPQQQQQGQAQNPQQGLAQQLFFGGGMQLQNQGLAQQQQMQQQQQQQPGQQQQQPQMGQMQQPNAQNPFGMMAAQNPLLGANLGFNVQQLQQLQLAQQLMAAGLPPQLAFGGGQPLMGGLGLAPTPQLAALSNPAAAMGLAPPNTVAAGLGAPQAVAQPNLPSSSAAGGGAPAEPAKAPGSSVGDGQDWAEPFSGKGKKEPPFPLKLHQILSNPEFQECICWNPHGRSWRILKPPVFEQLVIPLYFRHAKYASFMRQVNGWGFKRIVSGNDHNSYYHELFLRVSFLTQVLFFVVFLRLFLWY